MSSVRGKVIEFEPRTATAASGPAAPVISIEADIERLPSSARVISIAELYPFADQFNPELYAGAKLLEEALKLVDRATVHFSLGEDVIADDHAQRLRVMLPELFCLARLGDGFRAVVLATYHALVNLEGQPISAAQLAAIHTALATIHRQPFIGFDGALDIHSAYEQSGLAPDPKGIDSLVDAISSTSDDSENVAIGASA